MHDFLAPFRFRFNFRLVAESSRPIASNDEQADVLGERMDWLHPALDISVAQAGGMKHKADDMKGQFRGADGVRKLLRVAKAEVENLRIDLLDIERARAATMSEIEKTLAGADNGDRAVDVLFERRFSLRKSLNALETAYDVALSKLTAAQREIAKLDTLAAVNWSEAEAFLRRESAAAAEGRAPTDLKMVGG